MNPPSYASSEAPTEDFELVATNSKFDISPLPSNVSLGQIYRDWFKWLVQAAQKFYEETNADGEELWKKLSGNMGTSIPLNALFGADGRTRTRVRHCTP